jgi:hypothetical protein
VTFWLFGIGATVLLLAGVILVVGGLVWLVVWLIGRPLGWWTRRPAGFEEWWTSLSSRQKAEFKRWERRKEDYLRCRRRQARICARLRQDRYDKGLPEDYWGTWEEAAAAVGLGEFKDVMDAKDCPAWPLGRAEPPDVDRRRESPRAPDGVGLPPAWSGDGTGARDLQRDRRRRAALRWVIYGVVALVAAAVWLYVRAKDPSWCEEAAKGFVAAWAKDGMEGAWSRYDRRLYGFREDFFKSWMPTGAVEIEAGGGRESLQDWGDVYGTRGVAKCRDYVARLEVRQSEWGRTDRSPSAMRIRLGMRVARDTHRVIDAWPMPDDGVGSAPTYAPPTERASSGLDNGGFGSGN